ncbi:hypothetical protein LAZ67_10001182 [Cordylochernes scorpioides]|uniref:Transposase n=1 Tax=Cordylochernes scorpioides TaxID=51811 RepID=A0ABY6KW76_9ARAC|nr:hypothetical protein LAZ67_10001182 [Cordylochernes scorpioides]
MQDRRPGLQVQPSQLRSRPRQAGNTSYFEQERRYVVYSKQAAVSRKDCCLPPTRVYYEDSRRFIELLSPVLLLNFFTVLQLDRQSLSEITFIPDGGPPHISRGAEQLLKDTFGEDRWWRRRGTRQSPDEVVALKDCNQNYLQRLIFLLGRKWRERKYTILPSVEIPYCILRITWGRFAALTERLPACGVIQQVG